MKNKFKYLIALALGLFIGLLTLLGPLSIKAKAEEFITDGKWEFMIDKDLAMGGNYFSDSVIVEKENDNYYLTFSILDTSNVKNMTLVKGNGKVGVIERKNGKRIDYTYTIEEDDLLKPLRFRCFIVAMQKEKEFNITIKSETKSNLSDFIEDLGERPAMFVPKILVNAGDSEMNLGSYYQVMPAKATILDENIDVSVKAYYIKDNEKLDVEIIDNRFMLENVGEYHLIYRAESNKYKTNLGNNSYSEIDIKIISKINAASLAKVKNIEGSEILGDNLSIQAIKLGSDNEEYNLISERLKDISDNYEAINVIIYDIDGNEVNLSDNIELYLAANPTFNRTEIEIYHMDSNGNLVKDEAENFGRYMKINTNKLGTYILLVPGVEFHMPMWGYAIILGGAILVLAGIITVPIVIHIKRRKKGSLEG